MFCKNCGKQIEENSSFCLECGTAIEQPEKADIKADKKMNKTSEKKTSGGKFCSPIVTAAAAAVVAVAVTAGVYFYIQESDKTELVFETVSVGTEEEAVPAMADAGVSLEAETAADEAETTAGEAETAEEAETTEAEGAPAELSAALVDASTVKLDNMILLDYDSSGETSHIIQAKYDNTAKAAMDRDDTTSWQEAASGLGIGESIWYGFGSEEQLRYMSFKLGNWRNDRYYSGNGRPQRLKITVNDTVQYIDFPDGKQEYWVEFSPGVSGSRVSFTVEDAYNSNGEYEDTCIAEIGIYGEE